MRLALSVLLLGLIQPAMAINKCEIKGKISYQSASCPEHAKTQYLVGDKYITEQQWLEYQRKHIQHSEQGFKQANQPKNTPVVTEQVADDEIQALSTAQEKQAEGHKPPHVNVPKAFDYVNPKLEDMDRKLEAHNKKLQQLQNAE